ncbi:MAG: glycerol-3-phosphate dehydrogenase/oxidase [Actinobacteria bacterium]|nr:MAG: glycerol-3-phosphate dehydrogenase/oxidase [Actinomycetota bacterium]
MFEHRACCLWPQHCRITPHLAVSANPLTLNQNPAPVLILGAGINGAALARELALNGLGVVLVDTRDIASGATANSSRLIHGGLRYLEHGDFPLVRESLAERTRLLRLAPHFVRPLRLFIPVRNRFGGVVTAARRFIGLHDRSHSDRVLHRGLWTLRLGLWMYDRYARESTLPGHASHRSTDAGIVPVDRSKYPWVCSFSDAQILFPERFTLALLRDAEEIAAGTGAEFRVLTYHEAMLVGRTVNITRVATSETVLEFQPSVIVNATGAWVDQTLEALQVESKRQMGGTKGSHFITNHRRLCDLLDGRAVYTEAGDGRPIFILPFVNQMTLIGTTDELFEGDPADATATPEELEYLVAAVNEVFPGLALTVDDVRLHYAGVRPLPFSNTADTGAISRRHSIEPNTHCEVPLYSLIGGKLTTCRSLAEEAADIILRRLRIERAANSRERPIEEREPALVATSVAWSNSQSNTASSQTLAGTGISFDAIKRVIEHEWVTSLADLAERRLMLIYHPALRREALEQLADLLIDAGLLTSAERNDAVNTIVARWRTRSLRPCRT